MKYISKIFNYVRNSHQQTLRLLLFAISVTIIVSFFPKEATFKYEINNIQGKPWHHDNLIAPFDFAIKKSKDQLEKELNEAKKSSKLYFTYDETIVKNIYSKYENEFEEKWAVSTLYAAKNNPSIRNYISQNHNNSGTVPKKIQLYKKGLILIDSIYKKGVIELHEVIENKTPNYTIALLNKNIEEEKELGSFYTVVTAYNFFKKQLKEDREQENAFLLGVLENIITQNVFYNKKTTDNFYNQNLSNVSPTYDLVVKDQMIISKGEIVDEKTYQELASLKEKYEGQQGSLSNYFSILLGQTIVVILSLFVLLAFLFFFRKDIFSDNMRVGFLLMLIVLNAVMLGYTSHIEKISIYALPFCILPVIVRAFYDTRVALFTHVVNILILSFLAPIRFEFIFIQLIGGIAAIFSIVNMRNRSQIFIAATIVFICYCLSFIGINIMQEGSWASLKLLDFVWFGCSAMLALFSYPLIFIFEKMFGFISDVSLMELSDMNNPLLRDLSVKAPGTFQHSLQVANIAEDVIFQIGGNALLVRTGALYHDIGKMEAPLYFVENQATGINPHEDLAFEESASIIINHVIRGIELARKHQLPEHIIDFIRTHHGTTMTWYFYRSFKNAFPEEEIDQKKFQYPGPIPFSRETAVLMMADSVEAASRSLKTYDAENINNLVEKIINNQIEQNQFTNADITFKDITTIKKILKKKLMNIYHIRVEYPR